MPWVAVTSQQDAGCDAGRPVLLPVKPAVATPPLVIKVMDKRRKHQQGAVLPADTRDSCQNTSRHNHMREMARVMIAVGAAVARRSPDKPPQGPGRQARMGPDGERQAGPAADLPQVAGRAWRREPVRLHHADGTRPAACNMARGQRQMTEAAART